jgi:hypothetical protein
MLARTIDRRRDEILAYHHTGQASNGQRPASESADRPAARDHPALPVRARRSIPISRPVLTGAPLRTRNPLCSGAAAAFVTSSSAMKGDDARPAPATIRMDRLRFRNGFSRHRHPKQEALEPLPNGPQNPRGPREVVPSLALRWFHATGGRHRTRTSRT